MAEFLLYWRSSTVESIDPARIQWWAGSDWIGADNVRPGDVLWAVTSASLNDLRLVARIGVERVVHSLEEAIAIVGPDAWKDANHFAIAKPEGCRPIENIDLSEVARRLTFEGGVDRLPRDFGGRNLQRMRRLTPESAALLQRAWNDGQASQPPRFVWQKDELILALDLYFRLDRTLPDESHPEVAALSQLLRALPIHSDRQLDPTFRNPDGVALKLANFRAIEQPGRGMSRGNRLEKVVWDEFAGDVERLRKVAAMIGSGSISDDGQQPVAPWDEEEEFPEGRIALRLHVARERSRELVKRKKAEAFRKHGRLYCEACSFDFKAYYGELGDGFIECHHTVPVHTLTDGATTRLDDVVLVCSNCHRMIHRSPKWRSVEEIRGLVQALNRKATADR